MQNRIDLEQVAAPLLIDGPLSRRLSLCSFLGACLVVSFHITCEPEVSSVGWWAVHFFSGSLISHAIDPLFFAMSGFLLAGKMTDAGWWVRETFKRVRTLLIPYVLWNLLYWLFVLSLAFLSASFGQNFGGDKWPSLSWVNLSSVLGVNPFRPSLLALTWYVRALIIFVILSPALLPLRRRSAYWLLILIWLVAYYVPGLIPVDGSDWKAGFYKTKLFWGFWYFAVGVYLRWNPIVVCRRRIVGICAAIVYLGFRFVY